MSRHGITVIIIILGLLIGAGCLYLFKDNFFTFTDPLAANVNVTDDGAENVLPGPLRFGTKQKLITDPFLTKQGTITETNKRRAEENLPPLRENKLLNQAAEAKVRDMFVRQYFAHESPDQRGPSDLAKDAGYDFILVGENLALGNFSNDTELVQAWMDSPGHRANILKKNYTEIGVSVIEGMFEGKMTWLAVQEFGRPASDCSEVSHSLESLLEVNKKQLKDLEQQIDAKQAEVAKAPKNTPEYNQKAGEYNQLVEDYNDLSNRTKNLADQYNAEVDRYNNCLHAATI